ncbi:T9SS type A sorting domain-containing protein [Fluviicola sp.]|jgi:hypothetical protein|uniref:T9SS type A sorting domain-containing protein n=1 Tax=Fluviicola sp. TaxID=1917219 RepID=UPI00281AEB8C|nr:T9SS type A sorting domain-containing protein [Fluviicola sp.]MDR0802728.1 T9SS type A sorting domain-containing protein [Fluviicola sp.]
MKTTVLSFLMFGCTMAFGQEYFSTILRIKDAIGNTDSVRIGYDDAATYGIDAAFGEFDISGTPWDTLDIRLLASYQQPFMQTKKQIIPITCPLNYQYDNEIHIVFHAAHYPVSLKWTPADYDEECREASIISTFLYTAIDTEPGSPIDFFMSDPSADSLVINHPLYYNWVGGAAAGHTYQDGTDTIIVAYLWFKDLAGFSLGLQEAENIILFEITGSNVVSNELKLMSSVPSQKITLFDMNGNVLNLFELSEGINYINTTDLDAGIYFISNGLNQFKFIKSGL